MKLFLILLMCLSTTLSCQSIQKQNTVPFKILRNKALVAVKIADKTIPEILIDTGFAFDGLMIYNPDYKDSLDLSEAREILMGGAGSGDPQPP